MTFFKVNNQIRSSLSMIFSCLLAKMSSGKQSCFKQCGKEFLSLLSKMMVVRKRKHCYLVAFNFIEDYKEVINIKQ